MLDVDTSILVKKKQAEHMISYDIQKNMTSLECNLWGFFKNAS